MNPKKDSFISTGSFSRSSDVWNKYYSTSDCKVTKRNYSVSRSYNRVASWSSTNE